MLSKSYNINICRSASAPVHGIYMVDGLNITYKIFIFHLMVTVQLPGSKYYDTQMGMHSVAQNSNVNLAWEFHKYISNSSRKME